MKAATVVVVPPPLPPSTAPVEVEDAGEVRTAGAGAVASLDAGSETGGSRRYLLVLLAVLIGLVLRVRSADRAGSGCG
jgi:hypothetical protein